MFFGLTQWRDRNRPYYYCCRKMAENQIKKHFDKEIIYVIYSHDRADFISGGEVFEDTSVIIAHKNKYEAIID
jgi:hypothetical protein